MTRTEYNIYFHYQNCHIPTPISTTTSTRTHLKSQVRYGNHQKTTLYPTHHKLKLQERARIEGYLENRPYINPKIAKLGPTLVPKINCQGPKAFKMAPKSKKSKWQKQILQKKKHLFIRVKPRKLFRPVLNSKHSPIEPKKAQNDPQKA